MAHTESKSTYSKGKRKDHKLGKKIARRTHRQPNNYKNKVARRPNRNYSPAYQHMRSFSPLYYSGDYKPNTENQEETQENYDCFITQ